MRLKPDAVWSWFCPVRLGRRLGMSERTVRRAKSYLQRESDYYGLVFVTLWTRGGWRIMVALEERLRFDRLPLLRTAGGTTRHVRPNLTGEEFVLRVVDPDTHNTLKRNDSRKVHKRGDPAPWGEKQHRDERRRIDPAKREGYYHALARRLSQEHWDNCKVVYRHRAAVGYVRRVLAAGIRPAHCIAAYSAALHECHGMAVDKGISGRDPRALFHPGSTLARAYRSLGFQPVDTDKGPVWVKVFDILV